MIRRINKCMILFTLSLMIMLTACGGGGGGGGGGTGNQSMTAVVTLSTSLTSALPADTIINGYKVTVTLPSGVTVKASPDAYNPSKLVTDTGVVVATGSATGSLVSGIYTAASGIAPGTVEVLIASGSALTTGEFCKITCDIAAGTTPSASDFTLSVFEASGLVTAPTYSTVDVTSYISLSADAAIN